jgi:aromatic-L-amino-acid decarboxylase
MTGAARGLRLGDDEVSRGGQLLTDLLVGYQRTLRERPVVPQLDRDAISRLFEEPFPESPKGLDGLFGDIADAVIPNSTTITHPKFLAYVLGPPNGIGPFAEAIAAMLNQNCNFWQLSPAASVIERKVVAWLASLFGFPPSAGGLMTSGGSMASVTALSAALHDRCDGDFRALGWPVSECSRWELDRSLRSDGSRRSAGPVRASAQAASFTAKWKRSPG